MNNIIKPQEGKQEQFLSSPADIVFYGGAKGGGKTFGLLQNNPTNQSHLLFFEVGKIILRNKNK